MGAPVGMLRQITVGERTAVGNDAVGAITVVVAGSRGEAEPEACTIPVARGESTCLVRKGVVGVAVVVKGGGTTAIRADPAASRGESRAVVMLGGWGSRRPQPALLARVGGPGALVRTVPVVAAASTQPAAKAASCCCTVVE